MLAPDRYEEGRPMLLAGLRRQHQYYAVFSHAGPVTAIRDTWQRILREWLPNGGHESAHKPDFEVYGPRFDPDTGLGGLEIWIFITR